MDPIVLHLPNGKTLTLSQDEAHALAARLWDGVSRRGAAPGTAPMAVKLSEAASALAIDGRVVEVSEREYGALRLVLTDPPPAAA